ncbi:hypothetical protein [Streptomyces sp. NRRL WC-3742]|uniref:hypothetical protein n=1 Tax=Streptomyces sp. NRRL WC-3742 TaxID=1463934 RepID=UPI0005687A9C|nr:hypothetical protein [Streptomyces sp. NRRL WC-3742]
MTERTTDEAESIPRLPSWWRRPRTWVSAALALALAGGFALWSWAPWQTLELPQSACWSALSREDLKPLAAKHGKATATGAPRIQTPTSPEEPVVRGTLCVVQWEPAGGGDRRDLLSVEVAPAWNGVRKSSPTDPLVPLDFGPGAEGLLSEFTGPRIELYIRCDFAVRKVPGADPNAQPARYVEVSVRGDAIEGASKARARQAYADVALKVGRVAAAEYECTNQVQLPAAAPTVPAAKETAGG